MKARQNGRPATAGAVSWTDRLTAAIRHARLLVLAGLCCILVPVKAQVTHPDIHVISGLQTWEEFLSYFHGKPVMLCLWGTGCKPCIQLFAEHHTCVDSICQELGIEKVFMAVDYRPAEDSLFNALINTYSLKGTHIGLAPGDRFREQVFNVFFPKQGNTRLVAIPKYVLIGPDGRIVHASLPAPKYRTAFVDSVRYSVN